MLRRLETPTKLRARRNRSVSPVCAESFHEPSRAKIGFPPAARSANSGPRMLGFIRSGRVYVYTLLASAMACAWVAPAMAQAGDAALAESLFREGKRLL